MEEVSTRKGSLWFEDFVCCEGYAGYEVTKHFANIFRRTLGWKILYDEKNGRGRLHEKKRYNASVSAYLRLSLALDKTGQGESTPINNGSLSSFPQK